MMNICICGKEIDEDELYCSDRCVFIASKMSTPLGQRMDTTDRAVRYFGKIYDKQHGEK